MVPRPLAESSFTFSEPSENVIPPRLIGSAVAAPIDNPIQSADPAARARKNSIAFIAHC